MTDVIQLARLRRAEIRAEVEALDRFVGTAEWLLGSVQKPVQILGAVDRNRLGRIEPEQNEAGMRHPQARDAGPGASSPDPLPLPPMQEVAQARSTLAQSVEWMRDTFDFEQKATGAA